MSVMKNALPRVVLGAVLAAGCGYAFAGQSGTTSNDLSASTLPEVSFNFDRVGLSVPHFTLLVHEDGSGRYQAQEAPVAGTQTVSQHTAGKPIDRPITLSAPTVAMIFKTARSLNHFNMTCASKAKNIADTGNKTLSYSGPDGRGACTYNFSEIKGVMALTDTFQAIAFTMDTGRRLEFLHRYDRLGLDAEMETLTHEVEQKRALELGTISDTLTSLASDDSVLQRVRIRAEKLLELANNSK